MLTQPESPAAWAPEVASGAQLGRYVVERPLGAGGMGMVLAAWDPQLERSVALKLVRTNDRARARERLVGEARAMARLDHPNVVTVHEIVEAEGELVIVMERVDGADLATWLAERPRSRSDRLRVLLDAGRGLAAAHTAGLVHRDVKPANILVDREGRARLTDLGLAAALVDDAPELARGSGSRLVGTPGYLAPELVAGARGDALSDQYAFAITARQVIGDSPVLRRAAADRRGNRFPSMAVLLAAIERAERPSWPWIAAAGALVLGGAALVIAWPARAASCTADPSELGVWSPPRRAVLGPSLRDPTGRLAADVVALIDSRALAWSSEVVGACRVNDAARSLCLDDQRRELDAALARIAGTSAATALITIARLPPAEECVRAPTIANVLEYQRVHDELRRATALAASGRYGAARDVVAAISTSDPRLGAEVAYHIADWTSRAGDPKLAVTEAQHAVTLAELAHDDDSRLQAMIVLVGTLDELGRTSETRALAPLLEGAAARQPMRDAQRARVENVLGNLWNTSGDYVVAERHYRAGLVALDREYAGKPAPEIAGVLTSIGSTLHQQAKVDEAKALVEQAVAMFTSTAGPDHPDLAIALTELGNLAQEAGSYDEAAADYERVIAVRTKALGATHPFISEPLGFLARVEQARGHDDRAIALYRRARTIATAGFGADHPLVAVFEGHLAELVADPTEARALVTDAVRIWDTSGAGLPDAYDAKFLLAKLEWAAGDRAHARILAAAAHAGWEAQPPPYNKTATTVAAWISTHR